VTELGRDVTWLLVGHSMGGVAITEAAGRWPARISLLVYLAAMQPRDGQSLIDLTQMPEGQTNRVEPHLVLDGEPSVATLSDAGARVAFYGGCSEEQIAWATDELVAALDRLARGAAEPVAAGAGGCSPSPGPCPTRGAR
jgi:pimeloyl-ACP methyl ester carboxylesterase